MKPGDEIGIISPAGPVKEEDLRKGREMLESAGFRVRMAGNVYHRLGYLAGEDNLRLQDLLTMLRTPRIKAIINTRGGYGSLRLLDKIAYDEIKREPKIIVGFSDITALLLAVHAKTGVVTFHGPVLKQLGSGDPQNLNNLLQVLGSDQPLRWNLADGKALSAGKVQGPLLGGNLSLICHLLGTPYMPPLEGAILFIEETKEPLFRIDRMLTHLKLSGSLAKLSGMVIGQMEGCGDKGAVEQQLLDMAGELNIALATGLNVGHGGKNLTVPLGVTAELDTEKMILATSENALM